MKRTLNVAVLALVAAGYAATGHAAPIGGEPQLGGLGQLAKLRELSISDADEERLGAAISEKIRLRYGVVQDPAVHKYVTLVGMSLADKTTRPKLGWKFIVLDTDGVNAFAAPGGYVHITKGALALLKNEGELAGVLGHELIHVQEKHTIAAMKKGKALQMGSEGLGDSGVFSGLVDKMFEAVLDGFGRNEELESDTLGIVLANKTGYNPMGLNDFLTRLNDRNKDATEKQGLFASHPEMQERLDKISNQIKKDKLAATLTLDDRYKKVITYEPKPQAEIASVVGGAGLAGGSAKKEEEPKKRGFGLGNLVKATEGGEKKSAQVTASGGGRGVNTEKDAKGGENKQPVVVTLTPAEIAAFKQEGGLK